MSVPAPLSLTPPDTLSPQASSRALIPRRRNPRSRHTPILKVSSLASDPLSLTLHDTHPPFGLIAGVRPAIS